MSVRHDVDQLIDWAKANKPEMKLFAVACRPSTLRKFCKKVRKGPFTYRDCELVPVRPQKKVQE